jgi:hypothetical protein
MHSQSDFKDWDFQIKITTLKMLCLKINTDQQILILERGSCRDKFLETLRTKKKVCRVISFNEK